MRDVGREYARLQPLAHGYSRLLQVRAEVCGRLWQDWGKGWASGTGLMALRHGAPWGVADVGLYPAAARPHAANAMLPDVPVH